MTPSTPVSAALRNPMHLERPLKLTLSFTHSCNLDCKHCYADCTRVPDAGELSRDEWCLLIDQLAEDGVISLFIEGGEPLHRPDFKHVLRHCARRMLTMVRTNGVLVDRATAFELAGIGVGTMMIDFMGAEAATHDYFTGTDGSFDDACAAARYLLDAGVPTQMLIIMTRRNFCELPAFLELATRLGVPTVGVLRPYPLGRMKARWSEFSLSIVEMTDAIAALRPPPGMRLMQSWHPNDANCCWQVAAIDAHGNSIGCPYLREYVNYGNVRDMPFLATWDHPLYRTLRAGAVSRACPDCSQSQGSHGGCRSTAYAFHGRWDAPDPFDLTLNDGVDLRVLPDRLLSARPRTSDPCDA